MGIAENAGREHCESCNGIWCTGSLEMNLMLDRPHRHLLAGAQSYLGHGLGADGAKPR